LAKSLFELPVESVVLWNMTVCLRSFADAGTALGCIVHFCLFSDLHLEFLETLIWNGVFVGLFA
jgi:hypothetical protein